MKSRNERKLLLGLNATCLVFKTEAMLTCGCGKWQGNVLGLLFNNISMKDNILQSSLMKFTKLALLGKATNSDEHREILQRDVDTVDGKNKHSKMPLGNMLYNTSGEKIL